MEPNPFTQPELSVNPEQEDEQRRLQHGINVLDLLDREEKAEAKRADFLRQTHPGTDSRNQILNVSFKGDENRLQHARTTYERRYVIYDLRRQSMVELAGFLGISAVIQNKQVLVTNPADRSRLQREHGEWLKKFGGRNRTAERELYKQRLQSKAATLSMFESPLPASDGRSAAEGVETVVLGPAVDLEERAVRMTRAINAMARRSMLSGFDVAAVSERHEAPIWDRYTDGTPHVYQAARNKRERLLQAVKRDFWVASGFPALRDFKDRQIMPERELRPRSRKMWEEFTGQFEHPPQQRRRKAVRRQLSRYLSAARLPEVKIK